MIIFGILSGLLSIATAIPYCFDILRGRVHPARSTRIMMTLLMSIAFFQQVSLGAGWGLGLTVGELTVTYVLLIIAFKKGVGGVTLEDKICYVLLGTSLVLWLATDNAMYALLLTILGDVIAFWPTMTKTWRMPSSETALFYWGGVASGLLAVFAEPSIAWSTALFPLYIAFINFVEVCLIHRPLKQLA